MSRSGRRVVDIKSVETILTNSSSNKNENLLNKARELDGRPRSGSAVVDIETGEVISRSEYGY